MTIKNKKLALRLSIAMGTLAIGSLLSCGGGSIGGGSNTSANDPPDELDTDTSYQPPATSRAFAGDFPRLGLWWPNPATQDNALLSQYDWMTLKPQYADQLDALRTANPDQLILTSANACEVGFSPDAGPGAVANELANAIPAQWYLTQVGSTLSSAVDATTSTLQVEAVEAANGTALFIAGDTVLIGSESVKVTNVDAANKILTVERGFVRAASAHNAGERIAAHITFWPNSWVLNISTQAPPATQDAQTGNESFADYNARQAVAAIASANWNGIAIGRANPNQSWLIGRSTARTIDPDQSNTLLTDYSDFDAAWNAGLRNYETAIREAVGADKIIITNWGMANTDLLNGNNFEGFPRDTLPWSTYMFGPYTNGSYQEWMTNGQHPNLTTIVTYQDDTGPEPTDSSAYSNPFEQPGFVPDYQKMRFGLTSSLMNDGFFSYEINTNGHAALGLMWFDEYDNAGAGRGYLGQPASIAYRPQSLILGATLVNSDFSVSGELSSWASYAITADGYALSATRDGSSARLDITAGADKLGSKASFQKFSVPIEADQEYTLRFKAKASALRNISVLMQQEAAPYAQLLNFGDVQLSTEWQQFEISKVASLADVTGKLEFNVGNQSGTIWLNDISLSEGSREVWRRDFDHGIALVNASETTKEIDLGGEYRHLSGNQQPDINSGETVTSISLPAKDGVILLNIGD